MAQHSAAALNEAPVPTGRALYYAVRAGFTIRGTSLSAYCRAHGIHRQNAQAALLGAWCGPRASELVKQLREAAGVEIPR